MSICMGSNVWGPKETATYGLKIISCPSRSKNSNICNKNPFSQKAKKLKIEAILRVNLHGVKSFVGKRDCHVPSFFGLKVTCKPH